MLKLRAITASVLIPLAIIWIFFLDSKAFFWSTAVIMLLCCFEWATLSGFKTFFGKSLLAVTFILSVKALVFLPITQLLYISFLFWLSVFIVELRYPVGRALLNHKFVGLLYGSFVLAMAFIALNWLRGLKNGSELLMFCFFIIWGSDVGAYFVGRKFGKTKLAKHISPGKTLEGAIGGIILCCGLSLGAIVYFNFTKHYLFIFICIVTSIFSIVGDLFESMFKRNQGLKDSGKILPGHGGLLDRLDSTLSAVPVFSYGLLLMAPNLNSDTAYLKIIKDLI